MEQKPSPTSTVTSHVFASAYERGSKPALIDLTSGHVYGCRKLAMEITRAASGLLRRGARRDQVVGVHVSDACAQTLAVHTVIAAGGVAAPLDPALPYDEMAALLSEWDARMLITTPDLAESAVRAADESRVRQVLAFGPALDTVDFAELLGLEPMALPTLDPKQQSALIFAGGGGLTHSELVDAMAELDASIGLSDSDVVLVAGAPDGGCDLVALIGLAVGKGALVIAAGGISEAAMPGTVGDFGVTVVALPGQALRRL